MLYWMMTPCRKSTTVGLVGLTLATAATALVGSARGQGAWPSVGPGESGARDPTVSRSRVSLPISGCGMRTEGRCRHMRQTAATLRLRQPTNAISAMARTLAFRIVSSRCRPTWTTGTRTST